MTRSIPPPKSMVFCPPNANRVSFPMPPITVPPKFDMVNPQGTGKHLLAEFLEHSSIQFDVDVPDQRLILQVGLGAADPAFLGEGVKAVAFEHELLQGAGFGETAAAALASAHE